MGMKKHQLRPLSQTERIFRRDKGICWICLKAVNRKEASKDHIAPKSRQEELGLTDHQMKSDDNMKLAHKICNVKRGNQLEDEMFSVIDWELEPASGKTNRYANRPKGLRYKR